MNFFKTYFRIWQVLSQKEKLTFFYLVFLFFILGLLEILSISAILGYLSTLSKTNTGLRSQLLLKFLNFFVNNNDGDIMWQGAIFLILFFIIKNILGLYVEKSHLDFLRTLNNKVESIIINGYDQLAYKDFVKTGTINIRRNLGRTASTFNTVFNSLLSISTDFIKSMAIMFVLLFISFNLTVIGLISFGTVSIVTLLYTKKHITHLIKSRGSLRANSIVLINDFIDGFLELKLSQNNKKLIKDHLKYKDAILKLNQSKTFLNKLPKSINEISFAITLILAVMYFNFNNYDMVSLLPILFIFTFAGFKLNSFLANIAKNFQILYASKQDLIQTLKVLDKLKPYLVTDQEQVKLNFQGDINIEEIWFAHSPRFRIKKLSLVIKQGSFTAFCGQSGGGKTTLMLLIMGFLIPRSGQIKSGDTNIHDDIASWQRNIGYVSQNPYISNRSLKENIAFGLKPNEIDESKVYDALKLAGLESFVQQLQSGIDTSIKQAGLNLSGGELQRISIARALYHNPKILIFDEATASLDKENENFIKDTLEELRSSKTIIFVTHKLSSVEKADIIHVIEDGQIVDSGTYEDLVNRNSKYL
jgi:ATP-binding cassette, subfamily B, bacterial PglK